MDEEESEGRDLGEEALVRPQLMSLRTRQPGQLHYLGRPSARVLICSSTFSGVSIQLRQSMW